MELTENAQELLIRIDERTKNIEEKLPKFVTKSEFLPVRLIAYGLVSILCVCVIGAVVELVIK